MVGTGEIRGCLLFLPLVCRVVFLVFLFFSPFFVRLMVLRGGILNRTYGEYKNLYISLFLVTLFGPVLLWSPVVLLIVLVVSVVGRRAQKMVVLVMLVVLVFRVGVSGVGGAGGFGVGVFDGGDVSGGCGVVVVVPAGGGAAAGGAAAADATLSH